MKSKYKFEMAPYNTWVHLYTTVDDFDKAANCTCDLFCNGAVSRRDDGNLDLFIPVDITGYFSITTVAHEAFHIADFIADKVGLEYTHGTCNEHIAYLVGSAVKHILNQLEKVVKNG